MGDCVVKDSRIIRNMTGREVIDALQADTPLAHIRRIFSERSAQIEQASRQKHPFDPIEIRRMELQAANSILELFGIALS